MDRRIYFEELYRGEAEPWSYSRRAAESLRQDIVAATARSLRPRYGRVLDLGCSVGQLTARLAGLGDEIHGIDIAPTAAHTARAHCAALADERAGDAGADDDARRAARAGFLFAAGSSLAPPYRPGSFDLVLVCDGLHSWQLAAAEQSEALRCIHELVAPGGYVILTEHLKVAAFDPFLERIHGSPLAVLETRYLHDRPWYTLERALRRVRDRERAQRILASRRVGRVLMQAGRLAGRRGAKHVLVVAERPPT